MYMSSVALMTASVGMSGVKVEPSVVDGADAMVVCSSRRSLGFVGSGDDGESPDDVSALNRLLDAITLR